MGPIILLDKSTLQSLTFTEVFFLFKYFFVNVTPVLLAEILSDLTKPLSPQRIPEDHVTYLAAKALQTTDSALNLDYFVLLVNSLLGQPITMDRRPIIYGGRPVISRSGKQGFIIDPDPLETTVAAWKRGDFSAEDAQLAALWRASTRRIDLEALKKSHTMPVKRLKSLTDILVFVDRRFAHQAMQRDLLTLTITESTVDPRLAQAIFLRWEQSQQPLLRDFAPYAHFCLRLRFLFYWGLLNNLLPTKSSTMVDLMYLHYLPFTMIFTSNDRFHKTLTPMLLRDDQSFVEGTMLKHDLAAAAAHWNSLSETARVTWLAETRHRPLPALTPTICGLWDKYCPHWQEKTKGGPPSAGIPDDNAAKLINDLIKNSSAPPTTFQSDDADFVLRRRYAHIDDPCPCGSGKLFRDCHWDEVTRDNSEP